MRHFLQLAAAARRGHHALRAARTTGFHTEIDALARRAASGGPHGCAQPAHADLRPLRALWRLRTGNRYPEREPIFLAAALLAHGRDATLTVGRETAPSGREAHYLLWVNVNGDVASTGLPVTELYTPLATLPTTTESATVS